MAEKKIKVRVRPHRVRIVMHSDSSDWETVDDPKGTWVKDPDLLAGVMKKVSWAEYTEQPDFTGTVTFIKSGFKGAWLKIFEDVDYEMNIQYATDEDIKRFHLQFLGGSNVQ